MSEISEQITSHQLFDMLGQIQNNILAIKDFDNLNQQDSEYVLRIERVIIFLVSELNKIDPWLVSPNTMNNIYSYATNTNNYLINYIGAPNTSYIIESNNNVNNFLVLISQLNVIKDCSDVEGLRDSVSTFRRSASQHKANIEREYQELSNNSNFIRNNLNEIQLLIESQKTRIDTFISNSQATITTLQQQFLESQDKRREDFFNEKTERTQSYDEFINKMAEKEVQLITSFKSNVNDILEDSKKRIIEYYEELNQEKNKAQQIVGVISEIGLISGYQNIANKEKKESVIWNIVTGVGMISLIIFTVVFFIYKFDNSVGWTSLIARIFVTSAFGTFTAYSATQANKHEKTSRHNRRMELELATLDPYLLKLPETERNKIKAELAFKLFGNGFEEKNNNDETSPSRNLDLVKLVIDSTASAIKKNIEK